jgi:selenocysteine lyase/cysteine desulfurase
MAALTMPADGPLGGAPLADQFSPLDTDPLQAVLYERFGVEVPIVGWPVPAAAHPGPATRMIRISMALHNDIDDVEQLVTALKTLAG